MYNYSNFNDNIVPPYNSFNPYPERLTRVNGYEEAKAFRILRPNSTVALFDSNEDVFYIKSTDESGFSSIRIFRFEEVKEVPTNQPSEYVTKEEFEKFREEMLNYGKQSISTTRKQKPSNTVDDK